jgi:hypothetical protein
MVSATRDTRFGIGRTVPAIRDTRVRLVVLVYCQARATPNDLIRPNAATTVDYRVGQENRVIHLAWICKMTSECNKYAFSTLSEVVIQDLRVVIRDLQVVIRDLQRNFFWIIKFQTNGTFSLARRLTSGHRYVTSVVGWLLGGASEPTLLHQ